MIKLILQHHIRIVVQMSHSLILIKLGENLYLRWLSVPCISGHFFCASLMFITPLCHNFSFHILNHTLWKGWILSRINWNKVWQFLVQTQGVVFILIVSHPTFRKNPWFKRNWWMQILWLFWELLPKAQGYI